MITETDLDVGGGRVVHVYDTGGTGAVVFWQHGTPNLGSPPQPLLPAASERGLRWVSYDRPGYGGSTPQAGRDLAATAADMATVADALGVDEFAVMGHSGGASHALACTAVLGERVVAAVCGAGLAPFGATGLDWFAGMHPAGAAELRAATRGRVALEQFLASAEFDPGMFTPEDHAVLAGPWRWLGAIAEQAATSGLAGMVDDDLAYVAPWGCDPGQVDRPVLFVHGGQDRIVPRTHATWLARELPTSELWLLPDDGHVSVLTAAESALDWLASHLDARRSPR